jgi:DNA-binding transcriptional LysR family regulator
MDLRWLKGFITLARTGSFSGAADKSHISQPAFSRRIRAMERWAGVPLIDRSTWPTRLTPAGRRFLEVAREVDDRLVRFRNECRRRREGASDLAVAAQHTLAIATLPPLLPTLRRRLGPLSLLLQTHNLHDCVELLGEGSADLLLALTVPDRPSVFDDRFAVEIVGRDRLIPLVAADGEGAPRWSLPGRAGEAAPYLAYGEEAVLDAAVSLILERDVPAADLERVCENPVSEVLRRMALAGLGLAWLPESLAAPDIAAGALVPAAPEGWRLDLDVALVRRVDDGRERVARAAGVLAELIRGTPHAKLA